MSAAFGNRWWEARSSHGRKPIFATPEELWNCCVEYFEWNETNPMQMAQLVTYEGESHLEEVPKMRAMTQGALCLFLDISQDAWRQYRTRDGFIDICKTVEETIRNQKFVGAAAGFLNSMIIARDLGLKDQVASEHTGKNGGPITSVVVGTQSAEEAARAYQEMMNGDGSND